MDIIWAFILGIIQGIAEWLPISSSGHLALVQNIFNLQVPVIFDIMLHLGSLIAIVIIFWNEIIRTVKAFFKFEFYSEYGKLSLYIILASIATGIIGFAFKGAIEQFFESNLLVGIGLLVTSILLFFSSRFEQTKPLNCKSSLLIGLMQGIAVIPGISRSGSTISTGLMLGIKRDKLIRFSFLLSLPAILAAAILKINEIESASVSIISLLIGVIVSAVISCFALKWIIKIISEKKFHYFYIYCLILGLVVITLSLINVI